VLTSRSPRGGVALRVRLGELQAWQWKQIDWEQGFVTLNAEETKSGYAHVVSILACDMRDWLKSAHVSQTNAGKCSTMMVSRSRISARRGNKPARQRKYPISNFMISVAPPPAICAGPGFPRSSACASLATGRIPWSAVTTSWMLKTFKPLSQGWSPKQHRLNMELL